MDRISTGIESLNHILSGGFPQGAAVLIAGRPGTGKTILAHQMMFYNASQNKKTIYFTTLSEPLVKVMKFQQEFDFFEINKIQNSVIYYDLGSILRRKGPSQALITVTDLLKKHQPDLVIIDTIKTIADMIVSLTEFREFLLDLSLRLTTWGSTTLLLGEYSEEDIEIRPESAIADGIVYLSGTEEKRQQKRYLRILKMRGTNYAGGENVFTITKSGIEIYPRINPKVSEQKYELFTNRISTGVPSLDEMMRGGIPFGTTTLISGSSGTGKTILALHFALAGLKEHKKVVYVAFEENPTQIIQGALNLGLDLHKYIDQRLLYMKHVSPIELDVDEHVYEIQRLVEEIKADRLIIDSISSFEMGIKDKVKYTDYIWSLTDYFKTRGISVYLTHEIHNNDETSQLTKHGISYIADNMLLLKYLEAGLELKRYMRVVKMRSSSHDTKLREIVIDNNGFMLI